jgi:hypothetical protein
VEKELNLSYPTVRNRLSAAVIALGIAGGDEDRISEPEVPHLAEKRRSLLDQLARGEISTEDVAAELKQMNSPSP